jgi:hypothetical protein
MWWCEVSKDEGRWLVKGKNSSVAYLRLDKMLCEGVRISIGMMHCAAGVWLRMRARDKKRGYLEVLWELLVEFDVFLRIFSDVCDHVNRFLDKILANDTENLVLLQRFSWDVKREILRVDYTL